MIDRLLSKARQALATAERDLADGDPDAAANRCYYAAFYAAWAVFVANGVEQPRTHSGLIAEFGRRFVKNGTFPRALGSTLAKLESLRAYADYTLIATPPDKAALAIAGARKFIAAVESQLSSGENGSAEAGQ